MHEFLDYDVKGESKNVMLTKKKNNVVTGRLKLVYNRTNSNKHQQQLTSIIMTDDDCGVVIFQPDFLKDSTFKHLEVNRTRCQLQRDI